MVWIVLIAVLVIIGFILNREIFFYEAVHLGPRVQAELYDRWSKTYDDENRENQSRDDEMLAQPLLNQLRDLSEPFVLDFATGTGRFSYALMQRPEFKGRMIALDLSQGMLERAASKLSRHLDCVELLRHPSMPLPFPDATFDVVCALEVLELCSNMDDPLAEFARVLRPSGILLTSRGTEESGRKAIVKSEKEFASLLAGSEFENIEIVKWLKTFDRVLARKKGSSPPVSARQLSDVLHCRACGQVQWQKEAGSWKCQNCREELQVTKEGIILN